MLTRPDADDGTKPDSKIKELGTPPMCAIWGISYIKRKLHERKAKREHENPADKAAGRTADATVCIAVFTVVLAIVSIYQWRELRSSGAQTDQLIAHAGRLAAAAETANNNALAADRPWLGALLTLDQSVAVGNTPTARIVFTNSGKRPAIVISMDAMPGFFKKFPANPPYSPDSSGGKSSVSFLVPGAPFVMNLKLTSGGDGKISPEMMERLQGDQSFFIYAKADYIDVGTNIQHHTHACWKYVADKTKASPDGFYNCSVSDGYNDAN